MKTAALLVTAALALQASTPAERRIEAAKAELSSKPESSDLYNTLAMAMAQRARETADPAFYDEALKQLEKSFKLQPANFEGMKVKTWVLLGQHRFAEGLALAQQLNKKAPDDVQVYGFLADAHIELGNYAEAEKAAQWMLDLRPGNVPGLTRGAYLRELFGDIDGAIDFMRRAYTRIRPEETEDRAWVLTHIGHLQLMRGDKAAAEQAIRSALALFPDYHYALGKLGKIKQAQQKYAEAAEIFDKRYTVAPHPENLYDVAVGLHKAGRAEAAKQKFAEFEAAARKEMDGVDNANRELIFYYLDFGAKPAEALKIAEREIARRQDVHTRDAYAWALYRSGKHQEAAEQMRKALGVGLKEPEMLERASAIERQVASR